MAGNCGRLTDDLLNNCDYPLVGGVKDRLILINQDDVDSYTENVSNPQIITDITLNASPAVRAYEIEGINSSNDKLVALVKGAYSTTWNHQITVRIFSTGADVKKQIENMTKGKLIALVEHNYRGENGDAAFEILGRVQGLEVLECTQDMSDTETQGAWVLRLSSPEKFKEPNTPATFFDTNYATTKAKVDALLV